MSKRFFDRKVKEFHELRMGSLTMDVFINRFLDLLHYVPHIKEEKVKIQHFLGCIPPSFWDRIEFDMPNMLDTKLHKAILYYEHGKLWQENQNQNREKYRNFSDNRKPRSNQQPDRNKYNIFQVNKKFNKTGMKPYAPAPKGNKQEESGANVPL